MRRLREMADGFREGMEGEGTSKAKDHKTTE